MDTPLRPAVMAYSAFDNPTLDAVRMASFRQQVSLLESEGFTFVTAPMIDRPYKRRHLPERSVALAFLGGHVSLVPALEFLASRGIPATLFVPAGLADRPGFLSWKQIRDYAGRGFSIQSNGMYHLSLTLKKHQETHSKFRERVRVELELSREVIAARTGATPTALACPFGAADQKAVEAALAAGYTLCLVAPALSPGVLPHEAALPFGAPQLDDTLADFRSRLAGRAPEKALPLDAGVSVIIPTYNRKRILEPVLRSLLGQTYPKEKYEIIVVDDGSSDGTDAMVRAMAERSEVPLRYLWQEDLGFRAGTARNLGARSAENSLLVYIDGDIACHPDLIRQHVRCQRLLGPGLVLGYTCAHSCDITYDVSAVIGGINSGTLDLRALAILPDFRDFTYRVCPAGLAGYAKAWLALWSNNMSLERETYLDAGGFDENFHGWGVEDIEFGYRLQKAGVPFFLNREALGFHIGTEGEQLSPFSNADTAKFKVYAGNMRYFYEKHRTEEVRREMVTLNSYLPQEARIFRDERSQLDLNIGAACNNNCTLCGRFTKRAGTPLQLQDAFKRMEWVSNRESLVLSGGEPCLREDLPELVSYADFLLFRRICIRTNGRAFSYKDYAKSILSLGVTHAEVQLFGHTAELHDRVTRVPGSFDQAVRGIMNLKDLGARVSVNAVLAEHNRGSSRELLAFCQALGPHAVITTDLCGKQGG